jgi:quercetin dioxygenase-like cupin family protein
MTQTRYFPNWKEKVVFSKEGPQPQFLMKSDKFSVILGGLDAGQAIPEHAEYQAVYHFLEGEGVLIVDGERFPVQAGATAIVAKGAVRGMEAKTRLAFLAARVGD